VGPNIVLVSNTAVPRIAERPFCHPADPTTRVRKRSSMKRFAKLCMLVLTGLLATAVSLHAQGVTTAAVGGLVTGANRAPISGAIVTAVHQPSGTSYQGLTRTNGRYSIPGMRVGGPYRISVTFIGYEEQVRENVTLNLGVTTDLNFELRESAIRLEGIDVQAEAGILSSDRTGAATAVSREAIAALPTLTGRLEDFARLSPQYRPSDNPVVNFSFAGQDNRLNNITVDGSYFNNSFGLAGQPGDRTNVAPISMAAIEQIQINIAPFDVRQGNFVGASVNTVTRSGGNQFQGSLYHQFRDQELVGTEAAGSEFDPGTFNVKKWGGWLSGPIVQNRLFFFASYEQDKLTEPGTTFLANTGGQTPGGSITRVNATTLDSLSNFLRSNFDYETGPYQGYEHLVPATRVLAKLDFNLNQNNRFSLRYTHLDSETDVLLSNSTSLGFGNRRSSTTGLNFQNSNYQILENIRSVVGEWNAVIGSNMSNNLIVGYTSNDESRNSRGTMFPFVDILDGSSVLTSFGFEPFTPNNELRYKSFQLQNNFTYQLPGHALTLGVSAEQYESENVFFSGSQSVYIYNSLADFYTDANGYLADPDRTVSPVTLRRFQVRWSNIPGQEKPIQPLEVLFAGIYGQDEWQFNNDLKLTFGLRVDAPFFGDTGFRNDSVPNMRFLDENGDSVRYATEKLPGSNLLFSPRFGFNWDARGDRSTQVRGGTGIFTGRPAYVWISNQIGENGILTGFQDIANTTARPFNPDPNHYKPSTVNGTPAASYALAFTDPDFKFPQLWRTNIAVDQRLPWGIIGTGEFLYGKDVNGIYYINANLPEAQSAFTGDDDRPRWTSNRINSNISNAVVLKNQSEGYSWNASLSLEKPFATGLFLKGGYSYGEAKNTVDPGSIASGSWQSNPHSGDPNNPGLGYGSASAGHRLFGAASFTKNFFSFGTTSISLFVDGRNAGFGSFVYSGDLNGDGASANDLIYIPRDVSEMVFQTYTTSSGVTFTAEDQATAFEALIEQDDYLSSHRGEYAERGAVRYPMLWRADLGLSQDLFTNIGGTRNALQLRADIINFTNLLNNEWGVAERLITTNANSGNANAQILTAAGVDGTGRAQYRLVNIRDELITTTWVKNNTINDVYRIQIGLRYNFN
jgi:hypothetical protein